MSVVARDSSAALLSHVGGKRGRALALAGAQPPSGGSGGGGEGGGRGWTLPVKGGDFGLLESKEASVGSERPGVELEVGLANVERLISVPRPRVVSRLSLLPGSWCWELELDDMLAIVYTIVPVKTALRQRQLSFWSFVHSILTP